MGYKQARRQLIKLATQLPPKVQAAQASERRVQPSVVAAARLGQEVCGLLQHVLQIGQGGTKSAAVLAIARAAAQLHRNQKTVQQRVDETVVALSEALGSKPAPKAAAVDDDEPAELAVARRFVGRRLGKQGLKHVRSVPVLVYRRWRARRVRACCLV